MKNLTNFERKAIDFQQNSITIEEAILRMRVSCNICGQKGLSHKGDCKKYCPVQAVHDFVVDVYTLLEQEKEEKQNER